MYSESDIEAAVTAGAIDAAAARRLRDFVAANRAAPAVDEESFRLVTGFNDIFVTIAATLLLVAVGWIGGEVAPPIAGFAVAAVAWGLAEYFTRARRMALPSILLLLAFAGGLFAGGMALFFHGAAVAMDGGMQDPRVRSFAVALGGAVCGRCRPPGSTAPAPETFSLLAALLAGEWDVADASDARHRKEASGLVAAYSQYHLERTLRSLRMVERDAPVAPPAASPAGPVGVVADRRGTGADA